MSLFNRIFKSKYLHYFVICIMAILLLYNISNRYMFADESVEALIGKNILQFGFPKVWDGTNLSLAGVNGNEFNEALIPIRNNWLPYYIAALGQLISNILGLGVQASVGIMRVLFSLIGIAGAFGYYHLAKELSRSYVKANISLCLFAFSIPLLLYIRSIYYLAPTLTFTIITVLFYIKYINCRKKKQLFMFLSSAVFLFHSFYPYFFITVFSLILIYFIFDYDKDTFKELLVGSGCVAILTIPWYLYIRLYLNSVEKSAIVSISFFLKSLLGYVWQIHAYFFPFIPILILSLIVFLIARKNGYPKAKSQNHNRKKKILWLWKKRKKFRSVTLIFTIILINLIVISITNNFLDTRRMISSIPFLFILFSYTISYLYTHIKILGVVVLAVSLFTNFLHVSPYLVIKKLDVSTIDTIICPPLPYFNSDPNWQNKKADLSEYLENICKVESYPIYYLEEIMHTYEDADKGMVNFLNEYAEPGQKVYLIGYQYETIAFYTGLQVVNRLDPNDDPLPSAYKSYPNASRFQYLTQYSIELCDWIIERRVSNPVSRDAFWHDESKFEKIYIDSPDSKPWNEIWDHSFYTDNSFFGFYVYRNRSTTDPIT